MKPLACLAVALSLGPLAPTQSTLAIDGLRDDAPLTIEASATPSELVVDFAIRPEWHLYARDTGGGQPISFVFEPDSRFVAAGDPRIPSDEHGRVTGTARVVVPLRRAGDSGDARDSRDSGDPDDARDMVSAKLSFMVCDPLMCLPPMTVALSGRVRTEQQRVLLVVGTPSERSARIQAFVEGRGFACDVTTYGEVTTAACDGHDVVLADSELFHAPGDKGVRPTEFPRTATPIVAVGFLGTELIQAHGVAMASGYI